MRDCAYRMLLECTDIGDKTSFYSLLEWSILETPSSQHVPPAELGIYVVVCCYIIGSISFVSWNC